MLSSSFFRNTRHRRLSSLRSILVAIFIISIGFSFLGQTGLLERYNEYIILVPPNSNFNSNSNSDYYNHRHNDPSSSSSSSSPLLLLPPQNNNKIPIPTITKIRIIGERHSGTTFYEEYLKQCFPTINIQGWFLSRKHWFQPTPKFLQESAKKYGRKGLLPSNVIEQSLSSSTTNGLYHQQRQQQQKQQQDEEHEPKSFWFDIVQQSSHPEITTFQDTILLAFFRNPYQWMEAMRLKPHHWPNHCNITVKQKGNGNGNIHVEQYNTKKNHHRRRLLEDNSQQQSSKPNIIVEGGGRIITKSLYQFTPLTWQDFVSRPMILVDDVNNNNNKKNLNSVATTPPPPNRLCQKGLPLGAISPCNYTKEYLPPHLPVPTNPIMRKYAARLPVAANDVVYELKQRQQQRREYSSSNSNSNNGRNNENHQNSKKTSAQHNNNNNDNNDDYDDFYYYYYEPYQHPLELRADKIRNFLSMPEVWKMGGFISLRYEDIITSEGSTRLIQQLSTMLGISSQCPSTSSSSSSGRQPEQRPPHLLDPAFHEWITKHADWDQEARIGYSPEKTPPPPPTTA